MNPLACAPRIATGTIPTTQTTMLVSASPVRPDFPMEDHLEINDEYNPETAGSVNHKVYLRSVLVSSVAKALMVKAVSGEPQGVQ